MFLKWKMKKPILAIILFCLLLPFVSSLVITDTTFHSSVTNYTIYVDSITVSNVTVTNTSIEFFNVSSLGSNLTNANATFDAVASFIDLVVGFSIRNLNTSTVLFTSSLSVQDFNATFTPGQVLRIINLSAEPTQVDAACDNFLAAILVFAIMFAVIILAVIGQVIIMIVQGKLSGDRMIIIVKLGAAFVTVAVIYLIGTALINSFCSVI